MVRKSVDELRAHMDFRHNIRNMTVIAHVDHGKSTLTDSLLAAAGIFKLEDAGQKREMDTRDDEQDRTITIKSTGISLAFTVEDSQTIPEASEGRSFLINLIDSPGHVDFSSEVTAALRVTDGALVVVDCVEGVCVQTETVLRQALNERIKPVLTVNKLDRMFLELLAEPEQIYQTLARTIESVNVVIATYQDTRLGDWQVYPGADTVAFTAGLHGWGFTLRQFAKMYAKRFGVPELSLMKRLWGDNYFNPKTKKWSRKSTSPDGKKLSRGFCQFIIKPIQAMVDACMRGTDDDVDKLLAKLNVVVPKASREKTRGRNKDLLKVCMQYWLPAAQPLLNMMVEHLPSPVVAQKYRMEILYTGPKDDETAKSIAECNPDGPLVMYVSKMVPDPSAKKGQSSRFYAFGRVFSGTIATSQKVRILGPNYEMGGKKDLFERSVQRTCIQMGGKFEGVNNIPAGNTVALVGVDQYLTKTGTLTTSKDSYPLKAMKYSVSAVVRVAVEPKKASDLPRLVEGLKRLAKSDPLVECTQADNGEHIIAGAGELHLEICLKDLVEDFMNGTPVTVSDPVVSYCETVTGESEETCLAKSPNKHNRLYIEAEPLGDELTHMISEKEITPQGTAEGDIKARGRLLQDKFGWDQGDAKKIWCFGPMMDGANLLVECAKGVQYLNEIKDSCNAAFQWATREGPLSEERMRGIRFNLVDATLHADAIHRGGGQILPTCRRVLYAAALCAKVRLLEPVYLVEIQCPQDVVGGVYGTLSQRRGEVIEEIPRIGTPVVNIKAALPVNESFGFTGVLRKNTSGQAFPQMRFDHWAQLPGDPYKEGTMANEILTGIRKRKSMKEVLPLFSDYTDKL
jgi:elongation factor 2